MALIDFEYVAHLETSKTTKKKWGLVLVLGHWDVLLKEMVGLSPLLYLFFLSKYGEVALLIIDVPQ